MLPSSHWFHPKRCLAASCLAAFFVAMGSAGNAVAQTAPAADADADSAVEVDVEETSQLEEPEPEKSKPVLSAGIEEILELHRAGVSERVIREFIKNSTTRYRPGAVDILAMKEAEVSDLVMTEILLKARESLQAEAAAASEPAVMPRVVAELSTPGRMDPESYEFWWNHYGYPRVLSGTYDTAPKPSVTYYAPFRGTAKYRRGPSRDFGGERSRRRD